MSEREKLIALWAFWGLCLSIALTGFGADWRLSELELALIAIGGAAQ